MGFASELELGNRWTFVGGKGGVGKTTVAAALAVELVDTGEQVVAVSTDPAHSLGDALATRLDAEPATHPQLAGLTAFEVDADHERRLFLSEHGEHVSTILERGTYLDAGDVGELTDLAIPGMDELAAILRLFRLARDWSGRVIVDTAPTGHTIRLLKLPRLALGWIDALDAMDAKHQAIASTFGSQDEDSATAFLSDLRSQMNALDTILHDPDQTTFLLVTGTDPVVLAESRRYMAQLDEMRIKVGGLVVNRVRDPRAVPEIGSHMLYIPALPESPIGIDGLRAFGKRVTDAPGLVGQRTAPNEGSLQLGRSFSIPAGRGLYIVGGKGGVGKTTSAAAIALDLAARSTGRIRLMSVDPAGSLGDVLGVPVGPRQSRIGPRQNLEVQQIDSGEAWEKFQKKYRDDVERIFADLLGPGMAATYDREIVERLLDLAPPGLDELVALLEVVDSTEDAEYDALVLDTAPTGHFLRLMEMPELALNWTHSVLRILLKYRDVVRLGGLAEQVLELSRSFRRLRERLQTAENRWIVVVALPEVLSIRETERLARKLGELRLGPETILINKAIVADALSLSAERAAVSLSNVDSTHPMVAAPLLPEGPVGLAPLTGFIAEWRELTQTHRQANDSQI